MKNKVTITLISSLLILLFVYAGASKFIDFSKYVLEIKTQPLPKWLINIIIWGLPPLEIIIAICLLFDRTNLVAFYISLIVLLLFTAYTALILLKYFERIPCSCGGIVSGLSWKQQLILNIFFSSISIIGIFQHKNKKHVIPG
ncbi:MAG TPA: hypothetical protein PKA80_14345 [Ignavibacteriaceae bacterium]|nr:hypothetical protein [Ignavibacteriaceae bacterium]